MIWRPDLNRKPQPKTQINLENHVENVDGRAPHFLVLGLLVSFSFQARSVHSTTSMHLSYWGGPEGTDGAVQAGPRDDSGTEARGATVSHPVLGASR